ncbi:MAG: hypothetical protein WDM87_05160 [Terracidiphilus sp.]
MVATALLSSSRDTDLVGWYKDDAIVGTMFTGLIVNDKRAVLDTFLVKVSAALQGELTAEEFNQCEYPSTFFRTIGILTSRAGRPIQLCIPTWPATTKCAGLY